MSASATQRGSTRTPSEGGKAGRQGFRIAFAHHAEPRLRVALAEQAEGVAKEVQALVGAEPAEKQEIAGPPGRRGRVQRRRRQVRAERQPRDGQLRAAGADGGLHRAGERDRHAGGVQLAIEAPVPPQAGIARMRRGVVNQGHERNAGPAQRGRHQRRPEMRHDRDHRIGAQVARLRHQSARQERHAGQVEEKARGAPIGVDGIDRQAERPDLGQEVGLPGQRKGEARIGAARQGLGQRPG